MSGAQLEPRFRKDYILGGHAIVTLVSKRTGDRFTYRVSTPKNADKPHFVSVLTGPDNRRDYEFLGTIFDAQKFVHGRKSTIAPTAPSARAWAWTWEHLDSEDLEVWHEGSCSRCGRTLTDPESIQRGIGPTCAERGA